MDEIKIVRSWAQGKLDARQEPPWAVQKYNDLIRLIDEILAAQAATISLEDSLRDADHLSEKVVNIAAIRSGQAKITLPM